MLELKPLPYAYDALEPHIDEETMKVHHDKHHQAYLNKFKTAWETLPELKDLNAEQVLWRLEELKEKIDDKTWTALKNHGGGYVHHNIFGKLCLLTEIESLWVNYKKRLKNLVISLSLKKILLTWLLDNLVQAGRG